VRTRLPRQILIRGNACGLPGQAAQRCKQQQPTFLDTEAAVLHKHVDRKTLGQIVDELLEIRAIAS
jgi:hypothetical protein